MANKGYTYVLKANAPLLLLVTLLFLFTLKPTEARIGLTYDGPGNNLPTPQQVVNIYKANGIKRMRIYYPDLATLQAVQNSGIDLVLDVPNDRIQNFAQNPSSAVQWVQQYVVPYASAICQLPVGNEVAQELKQFVGPAMTNTLNALKQFSLGQIQVTTAISMTELINTYPPSNSSFKDLAFMSPIVNFLKQNGWPLLVNVYTYFTYAQNPDTVPLDYALFTYSGTRFIDQNNGLHYQNLFDALVDSVHAALGKVNAPNTGMQNGPNTDVHMSGSGWPSAGGGTPKGPNTDVHRWPSAVGGMQNGPNNDVHMSESGWPSAGGVGASRLNAGKYLSGLTNHANVGTPLKPGPMQVTLFSLFDNNQKPGDETERHFGIFDTNGQPKYSGLNFN